MLRVRLNLFLFCLLAGCVSAPRASDLSHQRKPTYQIGDCLMIVDLPSGETSSPHRVRVEKIEPTRYLCRCFLGKNRWDTELSSNAEGFEILEKISKKVNYCSK